MENVVLEMIEYKDEHQPWFEKFNRQWIEEYFWMEPIDFEVLQKPDESLAKVEKFWWPCAIMKLPVL